jgi:copper chaperone NosL
MRHSVFTAILLVLSMCATACTPDPAVGPSEIHWDIDLCERCAMAISDRRFTAQVRAAPGAPGHKFDDIGCALLGAHGLAANQRATFQVWVTDHDSGEWLDGRSAQYRSGAHSPMNYGFSAHRGSVAGGRSFDEVTEALVAEERLRRDRPEPGSGP